MFQKAEFRIMGTGKSLKRIWLIKRYEKSPMASRGDMMRIRPGMVLLLIWGIFLAAADVFYLKYLQPARIGKTVSDLIHDSTGMNPTIRRLSISIFPGAGVKIYGLELHPESGHDIAIRAEYCLAELSWLSLLRLEPVVKNVRLVSPVIDFVWKKQPETVRGIPSSPGGEGSDSPSDIRPSWFSAVSGMRVELENGTVSVREENGLRRLSLTGITLEATWPGLRRGLADLQVRRADIDCGGDVTAILEHIRLIADDIDFRRDATLSAALHLSLDAQLDSLDKAFGHPIADPYRYFPLPEPARFSLGASVSFNPYGNVFDSSGTLEMQSIFPMNGHLTPLSLSIPFAGSTPDCLEISNMCIEFDRDKGVLNGTLSGLTSLNPELKGTLEVEQFSLPRWFGFAQAMPAGLQLALDHITGTLEFILTPKGVTVPRITARSAGMTLTGQGSCADFSRPDVTISGTIPQVDLARLFPELAASRKQNSEVLPPDLPPPAIPLGDDDTPAPVGYKILLQAERANLHDIHAEQVSCLITPAQGASLNAMPEADPAATAPRDAGFGSLLTIAADSLYGGRAKARVHIDDICRIVAGAQNVDIQPPLRSLAGFSAAGGTGRLTADLSFKGDSPQERLETINGNIGIRLTNGFIAGQNGRRLSFSELTLDSSPRGMKSKRKDNGKVPDEADFTGKWALALKTPAWVLSAGTNAVMTLGLAGEPSLHMAPQKTSFSVEYPKGILYAADSARRSPLLKISGEGEIGFNTHDSVIKGEKIRLNLPGALVTGNARLNGSGDSPNINADLVFSVAKLRRLASSLGYPLPTTEDSSAFSKARLQTHMTLNQGRLSLKNLKGSLDDVPFSGTLDWHPSPGNSLRGELNIGHLNLSSYLPQGMPSKKPQPLPLEFLKTYDVNMTLRASELSLFSTPLYNVTVPLSLSEGSLVIGDITASLPGSGKLRGALHGKIEGRASELDTRFQLLLNDVDALALSSARKQETLIAGTGTLQLKLLTKMTRWSDALDKLNGTWGFSIKNGYFGQAVTEKSSAQTTASPSDSRLSPETDAQGTRTFFDVLSASGTINQGIAESKNFLLKGPALTVQGTGTLNLTTHLISADAKATLLGVPEIPIQIRGKVEQPETSYQIIGAVTGTLGNIGSSTLELVGNVLTAPFRLFTGKKTLEGH